MAVPHPPRISASPIVSPWTRRSRFLLICDIGNHRIRRVDFATGSIDTFGGTGERQPTPDGAPLKGTPLNGPRTIAFDSAGELYLALREGNAIYRVDGLVARVFTMWPAPGSKAIGATAERRVSHDSAGRRVWRGRATVLDVADTENHVIRAIDAEDGPHPNGARHRSTRRRARARSSTMCARSHLDGACWSIPKEFCTSATAKPTVFEPLAESGLGVRSHTNWSRRRAC